jgi:PKD repeat protein
VATLTVTDNQGALTVNTAPVMVTAPNQPPVAVASADPPSGPPSLNVILYSDGSYDPDGALGNIQWEFHDGSVYWGPTAYFTYDQAGIYEVTLTVWDNRNATGTGTLTIYVGQPNQPPVADAGPDQDVNRLTLVTLDGSGSGDPDGNLPLAYGWNQTGGPAVTLSNPAGVSPTFTAPSDPAVLTFTLAVTDSLGLPDPTPDQVVVVVAAGNQPPVADAGPDQAVNRLTLVTLDGSGSGDPDGDLPLAYGWNQTGGPAVTLSDPSAVSPTFTAPGNSGVLTFTLVVTDSLGLASPPDEVVITMQPYRIYLPAVIRH